MPPRWPRQPDRADPDYRRLDDRMNFALHIALFSAFNSALLSHGIYVFVISD